MSSSGRQGNESSKNPSISADGRRVAFSSRASDLVRGDTNDASDIFVHDLSTGKTERVSVRSSGAQANGSSGYPPRSPSISADGRFVAFETEASNLVDGDTNDAEDVFVHDLRTGETRLVSVGSSGAQGNKDSGTPSISADGRFVAFFSDATNLVPGDTNGAADVFRRGPLRWR